MGTVLKNTRKLTVQKAFCNSCNHDHSLAREPAVATAKKLMASMDNELSTKHLYGEARGKMFGDLVCQTQAGELVTLKAFSGQFKGEWRIKGWVPPLFDVQDFINLNTPVEQQIKSLGREAEKILLDTPLKRSILLRRKELSRQLMKDIHALYSLRNFRGERCSLVDLFPDKQGIPTGTGDCCAPKLLNYAAINGLHPLGLVEFYRGKTNKSASRHEGEFYPACVNKCGPILGFLLCGLAERVGALSPVVCKSKPDPP